MTDHKHHSNKNIATATSNTPISPAILDWKTDYNGHTVPVSRQFGDVYYSLVDGLAESRYVFLEQNQLPSRFTSLYPSETFTIAELGFGTGLNFFSTWLLWQQMQRQQSYPSKTSPKSVKNTSSRLHYISFEKYPLTKEDLIQALNPWKKAEHRLTGLIDEFIENYPPLIEGCHRLTFFDDNLTLDLWFGDATTNLEKLSSGNVNAWFLDGFAPSCNQSLWATQIFNQVQRLSSEGSTVATFSCAGVVKRGLKDIGFDISKVKGFGRKREMLTAVLPSQSQATGSDSSSLQPVHAIKNSSKAITIIGAGVSGLMAAWSFANRNYCVTILDKEAPLAGASGNPRGLLAPKMTPIHHVAEHLHSIGFLYASRLFSSLSTTDCQVLEHTTAMDLLVKANVKSEHIDEYPDDFAQVLKKETTKKLANLKHQDLSNNQYLPKAGLVNPRALAEQVLSHPLIHFQQANITKLSEEKTQVVLTTQTGQKLSAKKVIICTAFESCQLDKRIFDFRKIRGQLSWFTPTIKQSQALPKIPLKYGGYCASFTATPGDEQLNQMKVNSPCFLLGASFVRNDIQTDIRLEEHQHNRDKLIDAIPALEQVLPVEPEAVKNWHARVGIRAQTPDYHPVVGQVGDNLKIWTMSGMGSKGYAFAPICAEILVDLIDKQIPAVSRAMLAKLSPNRKRLQTPIL